MANKVCCPSCGHEFRVPAKIRRMIVVDELEKDPNFKAAIEQKGIEVSSALKKTFENKLDFELKKRTKNQLRNLEQTKRHLEREKNNNKLLLDQLNNGKNAQEMGLRFEEELVEKLMRSFPYDLIWHEGKRGDVIQNVVLEAGEEKIGTLVYECKRVKQITKVHIKQTIKARKKADADFAVLVTTGSRKGFEQVGLDSDIIICSPQTVFAVTDLLRKIVKEYSAILNTGNLDDSQLNEIRDYLTSREFVVCLQDWERNLDEITKTTESERLKINRYFDGIIERTNSINEIFQKINKSLKLKPKLRKINYSAEYKSVIEKRGL